jgi:hypothetical protein
MAGIELPQYLGKAAPAAPAASKHNGDQPVAAEGN